MRCDFLICSERSGSNLITRLLNAHSAICAPATTHLFRLLGEHENGYGDLRREEVWEEVLQDVADLLATTLGDWRTTWNVAELKSLATPRSMGGLLRAIYQAEAKACGKRQLFIKEIEWFRCWRLLDVDFPDARYVYFVRDPRDMALSWKGSAAIRGGVVRAADAWLRDQQAYLARMAEETIAERTILATYEQLLRDPEETLSAICRFLGCTFEPAQLDFHAREDTASIAKAAADFRNLARPLLTDNVGKYRAGLSYDELAYVEATCGGLMDRFGYQTESLAHNQDRTQLRARLEPLEPRHKEAYQSVSATEKERRAAWVAVRERMQRRRELVPIDHGGRT